MSTAPIGFPALVQDFFQRRLLTERGASGHTVASYRDTFALLLRYAAERTGRSPAALTIDDLQLLRSGASRSAVISSRVRKFSAARSKRFGEMASTRWATGRQVGSRREAWAINARIAVRRRFRVRALLPRPRAVVVERVHAGVVEAAVGLEPVQRSPIVVAWEIMYPYEG